MINFIKFFHILSFTFSIFAAQTTFQSSAYAASCGGLNQRACHALKKGPRCGKYLRKKGKYCRPCGGLNKRACPIVVGYPLCRKGLKNNFGKCVSSKNSVLGKAKAQYQKWEPIIKLVVASRNLITLKQIQVLAKSKNPREFQRALESNPRMKLLYASLKIAKFKTFTVGIESSGSAGVGYARETGVSLDVNQRKDARLYAANSGYAGGIANVGNEIVFSAYTASNSKIGGKAWGAMGSASVGSGLGLTIWYDRKTLQPIGFSINVGAGSVGAGGALVSVNTKVY